MHNAENVTKAGPSGDSQFKNSGFTDGLGLGQAEGEEGWKGCNAYTHKSLGSVLSLSFPHHMLYVLLLALAGWGKLFNVQLALQPSKACCFLHLVHVHERSTD